MNSIPTEPRRKRSEAAQAWLYLAPAGVVLLVFWFLPIALSFGVSFTNWEGADTLDIVGWVGWRNYRRTLADEAFWLALANTVNFALLYVPLTLGLALAAALALDRQMRASRAFRSILFLPYVTTWVSVSIVWRFFFDQSGPLNAGLQTIGIEPLAWLQEPRGLVQMFAERWLGVEAWPAGSAWGRFAGGPSLAMTSIVLSTVWRDVGFFMVIFLAGLNNIDPIYHEAARLDGAGAFGRFRRITLPLLSPTIFFVTVISLIGAFRVFVPILVMTPTGGPAGATTTLVFYLFQKGFMQWKLGQASAIAYLLFIIIALFTLAQNRLIGRRVQYEQ